MAKYHINKKGEVKVCASNIRECPLGGEHFSSEAEAYRSIEKNNSSKTFIKMTKSNNDGIAKSIRSKISDLVLGGEGTRTERLTAGLTLTGLVATGAIIGGVGVVTVHNNNVAAAEANSTPYSVGTIVRNSSASGISGTVMGTNLQKSSFDSCVKAPTGKYNVVCKTNDGKYTVTAEISFHTQTQTAIVGKTVVVTPSYWKDLSNVKVTDNTTNNTMNLNQNTHNHSGINYYTPKAATGN